MSELCIRLEKKPGYDEVLAEGNGLVENIVFALLRLEPGQCYTDCVSEFETLLVLLEGSWSLKDQGNDYGRATRMDIYTEKPTGLFMTPGSQWTVTAEGEGSCTVAVLMTPSDFVGDASYISADDVQVSDAGPGRVMREIVGKSIQAEIMLAGESILQPGGAAEKGSAECERVYYVRTQAANGIEVELTCAEDPEKNQTCPVADESLLIVPKGYSLSVKEIPSESYFLWALAGDSRDLHPGV